MKRPYSSNPAVQRKIEWLLSIGCPPIPVAPKPDPRNPGCHHQTYNNEDWGGIKVKAVNSRRPEIQGNYCRISNTKIDNALAPIRGDYCRLDKNLQPIERFTGKNPSYISGVDEQGRDIIKTVLHRVYQDRMPTEAELYKMFANPRTGVGTLGGHNGIDWLDFDAKNYESQQACDDDVQQVRQAIGPTHIEKTGSGGWRIAAKPSVHPDFTNFTTNPDGDGHIGEALWEGRFTVLAPTIHPNGNAYVEVETSPIAEIESLEAIGIYATKAEKANNERRAKWIASGRQSKITDPADNPWDIRNLAEYLDGYRIEGDYIECRCPAHDGTTDNSLNIHLDTGAVWCWSGCDSSIIRAKVREEAIAAGFTAPTEEELWEAKRKAEYKRLKSFTPTKVVSQKYIDVDMPGQGTMTAIKSAIGTGKTELEKKLVRELYANNKRAIILNPLNVLGINVTHRINSNGDGTEKPIVVHLQSYKGAGGDVKQLLEQSDQSINICPDSILAFEAHHFNGRTIFVDEANAIAKAFLSRKTSIARDRDTANYLLKEALNRAERVVLLDGNLQDWVVAFFYTLAPHMKLEKIKNDFNSRKFTIKLLNPDMGSAAIYSMMREAVSKHPIAFATDSKDDGEATHNEYQQQGLHGYFLSSKSKDEAWAKEFLRDPDAFLKERSPQYLGYTPSAESGVDVSISDYFKEVFAVFKGVVTTDSQTQALGRVRDTNCPRIISCPKFGMKSERPFSRSVFVEKVAENALDYLMADAVAAIAGCPNEDVLKEALDKIVGNLKDSPRIAADAVDMAIDNYERSHLFECLKEQLEESGHNVEVLTSEDRITKDETHSEAKTAVKIENSLAVFNADDLTGEEAAEISNSSSRTYSQQCALEKHQIKERLPGIEESGVWSEEFVHEVKTNRHLIGQIEMYFLVHHPAIAKLQNVKKWAKRFKYQSIDPQSIKSRSLRVKTLIDLGLMDLINVQKQDADFDFNDQTEEVKQFWWKCKSAKVQNRLGLSMGKRQPIQWLGAVLESIGLDLEMTRRTRIDGKLVRFYRISYGLIESEEGQAILGCLYRKYQNVLDSIDEEVNTLASDEDDSHDLYDFGMTGDDAEAIRNWVNQLQNEAKKDAKKHVQKCPLKMAETVDTPSLEGVPPVAVVSIYNTAHSGTGTVAQIDEVIDRCWSLTSWQEFMDMGQGYSHDIKQAAWDKLRSTDEGLKRSQEILAYKRYHKASA